MRTTAIMNLKGGTGKTVTAINLAAILAQDHAQRVLLVDADSQANLTEFVLWSPPDKCTPGGFADLLRGMEAHPLPTKISRASVLHADETLMALDVTSAGTGASDPMALSDWLSTQTAWDWCVIDCPPAFSAGAAAALIAADEVVIPLKLDAFGMRGLANLLAQIRNMRKLNAGLEIAGVLPTMFYPCEEQKKAEATLRSALEGTGIRLFPHITRSPKVDDMTFSQLPIIDLSPRCKPAREYRAFVGALLEGGAG